jgi:hypothetical protein
VIQIIRSEANYETQCSINQILKDEFKRKVSSYKKNSKQKISMKRKMIKIIIENKNFILLKVKLKRKIHLKNNKKNSKE